VASQATRYRTSLEDSARWHGFEFRDGDIVISAPSKCGTTWVQMICALLVFQTADLPAPLTTLSPWLDMRLRPPGEVRDQLDAQRHRRFIKTHTPLDGVPSDPGVTYLVIGRDPRDVAVSLYHQRHNLKHGLFRRRDRPSGHRPAQETAATAREAMLNWIDDDQPPHRDLATLAGMVWHLADAWSRRHRPTIVLLHYHDLTLDLEGQMRHLADRLGLTVAERAWPRLVDAATFAAMRQRSDDLVPDEHLDIFRNSATFFHSGTGGHWRAWLTDDDLARYQTRLSQLAPPDLIDWLHHGSGTFSGGGTAGR
jgi:hypothetical protein